MRPSRLQGITRSVEAIAAGSVVAGILIYGYMRAVHEAFYSRFGVRPEEVGVTYGATIGHIGTPIALLVMYFGVLSVFAWALTPGVLKLMPKRGRQWVGERVVSTYSRTREGVRRTSTGRLAIAAIVAILPLAALQLPVHAERLAAAVASGKILQPSMLHYISAQPVTVEQSDRPAGAPRNMMLLGSSGGTAVLFDLESRSTVWTDLGRVEIRSRCSDHYGSCIPESPPDIDCHDLTFKNVSTDSVDPHGLDPDRDGLGCEGATRHLLLRPHVSAGILFLLLAFFVGLTTARLHSGLPKSRAAPP